VLALLSAGSAIPRLLAADTGSQVTRGLAAAGGCWLVATAVWLYLRGRPNPVVDLLDAVALFAVWQAGEYQAALSFAYPVSFMAALYGSRRRMAWRASTWIAAFVAGLLASGSGSPGDVPGHIISLGSMSAVLHMLVTTLQRNEQAITYQRALASAGARLVAAQTLDEVRDAALEAAHSLLRRPRKPADGVASLALPSEGEIEVVAARGLGADALIGRRFPADRIDPSRPSSRIPASVEGFHQVLLAPLVVDGQLTGVLTLATAGVIPKEVSETLEALAAQTTLALERVAAGARFRSLVQHSSDVVTVVAPGGLVTYQSASFARLTGGPPEATLGAPVVALLHPDDAERVSDCLADPSIRSQQLQLRWRHADGAFRTSETVVSNLVDDPSVGGWVLNTRDVSERSALELELRHAQKLEAVGRLSAGVAHEINTPIQFVGDNLNFVSSAFETLVGLVSSYRDAIDGRERPWAERRAMLALAEDEADVDFLQTEVPNALREAADGIQRVSSIVRAMKAFGHPDGTEPEAADLNEALESTITVARAELKYVADVDCDFGDIPPTRCFKGDLNQVFLNLLVNAAHAIAAAVGDSGGRGTITVRTWVEGDDVLISIGDTGTGIPEAIRAKVFDPFFTTKEVGRGTGQGLSLAQAVVVDRHGGAITLESEVGVGTTFVLRLPVDGAARTPRAAAPEQLPVP
jgi:PAS domain S-box-containing protein